MLSSHPNFSLSLSLSLSLSFFFSFSFFSGRRTLSSSSSSSFFFGVPCFLGASTTKAPCELLVVVRGEILFFFFIVKFPRTFSLVGWGGVGLGWVGLGKEVGFGGSGIWVISDHQQFVAVLFSLLWWDLGCLSFD